MEKGFMEFITAMIRNIEEIQKNQEFARVGMKFYARFVTKVKSEF